MTSHTSPLLVIRPVGRPGEGRRPGLGTTRGSRGTPTLGPWTHPSPTLTGLSGKTTGPVNRSGPDQGFQSMMGLDGPVRVWVLQGKGRPLENRWDPWSLLPSS